MSDSTLPVHAYEGVVKALRRVFDELKACGLDDILSKGGVGSILLAHQLGHRLVPGDKGADGADEAGKMFEYKVSTTNQFNFNFGGRPRDGDVNEVVRAHFRTIAGAYCGLRDGPEFVRIVYCPTPSLVEDLGAYFLRSKSNTMVKNFSIDAFAALHDAIDV